MHSTEVSAGRRASVGRRRAEPTSLARRLIARVTSGDRVPFDSWAGAIWVVTIGLDFFWLSNPVILGPFEESLQRAGIATAVAVVATLPRFQLPRPSWAALGVLATQLTSAVAGA